MNKRKHIITIAAVLAAVSMNMTAQPAQRTLWNDGWTFTKDGESRVLDLPHDWGVDGPFVQEYPGRPENWPGGARRNIQRFFP